MVVEELHVQGMLGVLHILPKGLGGAGENSQGLWKSCVCRACFRCYTLYKTVSCQPCSWSKAHRSLLPTSQPQMVCIQNHGQCCSMELSYCRHLDLNSNHVPHLLAIWVCMHAIDFHHGRAIGMPQAG
eukprot:1141470-Pelagomonas_calceolata.AAC.3